MPRQHRSVASEQIQKFQPDRTLYLRGFDGTGAAAALYQTSPTGFSVSGVYRDMADFCVLVVYDADNIFEHYTVRYLPDFDLSGMVLSFDLTYQGLQCIDSAKFSWIDWATLDVVPEVVPATTVVSPTLWDHATLVSGNYTVAQGTFTITAPGNCYQYDRLTLFVNNASFDFTSYEGGETADYVARYLADKINTYDWAGFGLNSVSVIASADNGQLALKYARTGLVNTDGTEVTWVAYIKFPGIAAGSTIYIAGGAYTVASVNSPTSLTLTSSAGIQSNAVYLAEYGGDDGNGLTVYFVVRPGNINLAVDKSVLPLTGGNSDNVTWNIQLDFTALGFDKLRQAWLTFAPKLPSTTYYADTEWTATFSNWQVTDPNNIGTLKIAGTGSVRVGNADTSCTYTGSGWAVQPADNYWRGFSRVTSTPGSVLSVSYSCAVTHDLYLGTSLYIDRGQVSVSLDGDTATTFDCYLDVGQGGSELVTRRLLRSSVAAGSHVVTFTLLDTTSAADGKRNFIFDYIEAAVPTTEIPDALVTYSNVSPALDYDTDATYKMSPQRILWHLQKLGFRGQLNEYLGVFWWNQRIRKALLDPLNPFGGTSATGDMFHSYPVTFSGTITNGDYVDFNIGGFVMQKSIISWDTLDTIAAHFVYYINSASVATYAAVTGPGQFTVYPRTPNWSVESVTIASYSSVAGSSSTLTVAAPGDLDPGNAGMIWQVDPTVANPLNFAIRQWHSDMFSAVKAAGMLITTSFSMELVYPPDCSETASAANAWQARFADQTAVTTDTNFASLLSSQCAFIPNMTAFQQSVFTEMAGLQAAAGLTPWLQFGEFLWWFFSSMEQSITSLTGSSAITIGLAAAHKMSTGDRVVVSLVQGCTAANGTWSITVIDDLTFSIPVAANGAWVAGTGQVNGGSMAYYDPVTKAAAQSALGRPLYQFTCQNDDPTVNGGADTAFLAGRLKAHVDAIRTSVLAQYPSAKFEVLYPNDVNNPVCLLGFGSLGPQGGRMNAAVNLPPQWLTQPSSGLDRFKVEALSWGANYLNADLSHQAVVFALTAPMAWDTSNVAYLVPWFNGTCPWPREFSLAHSRGIQLINFWAYDHLALMSWPIPLPGALQRTFFEG
jgi:hypothetical protein